MNLIRIPSLKSVAAFADHVQSLGIDLRCEQQIAQGADSALTRSLSWKGRTIGNRWAVQPMEGWDGTTSGGVTDTMIRRWQRFGQSGAKLIWGGEAMAVRADGRANPNQLILNQENKEGIALMRQTLIEAHRQKFGRTDDLVIGFQLTHSGRFCRTRPDLGVRRQTECDTALAPPKPDLVKNDRRVAFRHPILDKKFGITNDEQVFSDEELTRLVDDYVIAARLANQIGADFVDIKHCHGYLLHELLAAHTRPGQYGGSFENRTRMLRQIVAGIRVEAPGLQIGVRLSAFDMVPFKPNPELAEPGKLGPGMPEDFSHCLPYRYGFGVDPNNPLRYELTETVQFLALLEELGITLVNLSAGSPYYNPHIQRPAIYPPSDGYQPPEDPLVGVARQINVVKQLKARFPDLILVGSAYSYLQEYLPHVAQYYVGEGQVDVVGIGRAVLAYPEILADATGARRLDTKRICRTFSDCTTAPRKGLRSGCYPLDDFYRTIEDAQKLKAAKKLASTKHQTPAYAKATAGRPNTR